VSEKDEVKKRARIEIECVEGERGYAHRCQMLGSHHNQH